ncbi:MAG: hypothetical protein PVG27_13015 [Chloroflexota bacterium]|jgi:flagellar basal body-associated protein FliL
MSATPGSQGSDARSRRRWIAIGVVAVVIAVVLGVVAVWYVFFSSEAPPAPNLNDALQVLQSAPPAE